tara:strand:+ start:409 stop:687 length:279 start_codon:yes stop_codon:yes gene_type:complete
MYYLLNINKGDSMKKIIFSFICALAFTSYLEACPYQKMAEVDEKLYSDSKINPETFAKISNLRMQGEKALKIGELSKSEEILDKALALFSNN